MVHTESHTASGALQQMEEGSLLRDFTAYIKRWCNTHRRKHKVTLLFIRSSNYLG